MLVNPKAYLARARAEGWALGGFNVFNLESARAVIAAGEESAAPLLLQTSEGAVQHVGLENMVALVRQLAGKTHAPVALHLDHGKSEALARAAIDAGYTSVMIDASRQTFERTCARRVTSSPTHRLAGCTSRPSSACSAASRIWASKRASRC
jgi:fructose/tagatose bisphosphate aldolase